MPQVLYGKVVLLITAFERISLPTDNEAEIASSYPGIIEKLIYRQTVNHGGSFSKNSASSFYSTFSSVNAAVETALLIQRTLSPVHAGEKLEQVSLKMAIDSELSSIIPYSLSEKPVGTFNLNVDEVLTNRTEALLSLSRPGQMLLSSSAHSGIENSISSGVEFRDLGDRLLPGLSTPQHIYQIALPDLAGDLPETKNLDLYPGNLPSLNTTFLGREHQVAEIIELIRKEKTRLLTLTGPGGTGKTRLALKAAGLLKEKFADGVFVVSLVSIRDYSLVGSTIAKTVGISEMGEASPIEALREYLRNRKILLVLDNFEQVVEAAPLLNNLLENAPGLKVIVTSRTPLHLSGEKIQAVPPLKLPNLKALPALPALIQIPSIELFVHRARLVNYKFNLTRENAAAIAEICVRLDGLPLAIELAAARVKILTPQLLLARLVSRLKLLTGGPADFPAHHQTLRGTIDWSYNFLEESEKRLFARLGVFLGGWTVDAALSVCEDSYNSEQLKLVLDSLCDKSLICKTTAAAHHPERYTMLETIREYALEKLGSGSKEFELRNRIAVYYLALVQEAEPNLTGPEQQLWFHRLELEHDNLRESLGWLLADKDNFENQQQEKEILLGLGAALWRFWQVYGYLSEGRRWLDKILVKCRNEGCPDEVKQIKLASLLARTANGAASLARDQSDFKRATELLEETLTRQRVLGDKAGIANALNTLGSVLASQGDYSRSMEIHREGLSLRRLACDQRGIAVSLCHIALLSTQQGDLKQATACFEEGLSYLRPVGDQRGLAIILNNYGELRVTLGDFEGAKCLFEESLLIRRELNDKSGVTISLISLGMLAIRNRECVLAEGYFTQSLELLQETGDKRYIAICLEGMAENAGEQGKPEKAAQLFGAAQTLRKKIGAPIEPAILPRYEYSVASARNQIEKRYFDAAWSRGRDLPLEYTLDLALSSSAMLQV